MVDRRHQGAGPAPPPRPASVLRRGGRVEQHSAVQQFKMPLALARADTLIDIQDVLADHPLVYADTDRSTSCRSLETLA